MTILTSVHNPHVKALAALRERSARLAAGLMLVEGFDELIVALASGARPAEIVVCPPLFRPGRERIEGINSLSPVTEVGERVFEKLAYRDNPDGWLATFPLPDRPLAALSLSSAPLVVVCESVEKPGNLGAVLRTADAAGVDALLASDPRADWGNPNVVRASKGALFTVPVASAAFDDALAWLRANNLRVVVASPDADTPYTQADLATPCALVVGTEHDGLTRRWHDAADLAVHIPMHGTVNSLNVSIATALLVYEARRQRG